MGFFFKRENKKSEGTGGGRSFAKTYDKDKVKPAIRCSICNGEQVAGFLNKKSGHFEEIALLKMFGKPGNMLLKELLALACRNLVCL